MKTAETFSFGTDFHGNLENIEAFLETSQEREVDHVIFGGDIAPKKMAVRLQDGIGLPIMNTRAFEEGLKKIAPITAEQIYRQGYMLFDSDISSEELEKLPSLVRKLSNICASTDKDRTILNADEVGTFEKHSFLLFGDFIINSDNGNRIFERYCSEFDRMFKKPPAATAEEFLELFIIMLKIKCYPTIPKKKKTTLNEYIFGSSKISADDQEKFNKSFQLESVNLQTLLHGAEKFSPWEKWLRTLSDLHLYGEEKQRIFLHDFFRIIREFRQRFKGSVSIISGNDDMEGLTDDFEEADKEGIITYATNKVVTLSPSTQLMGYSHVPPVGQTHYEGWFKEEETIRSELKELAKQLRDDISFCILNAHCAPIRTNLDQAIVPNLDRRHFGSKAMRHLLETTGKKIDLALFGHIHRSWQVSGSVQDKIRDTRLFNPGDNEYSGRFLFSSLSNPEDYSIVTT